LDSIKSASVGANQNPWKVRNVRRETWDMKYDHETLIMHFWMWTIHQSLHLKDWDRPRLTGPTRRCAPFCMFLA
jgi:hypothetical protein